MLWSMNSKEMVRCDVCGREEYGLPIITNLYLEPAPSVCEKCFFEKVIGKKLKWSEDVEKWFLIDRSKKLKNRK